MKQFFAILTMILIGTPAGAEVLMDCWDGTFAYNEIVVTREPSVLKVELRGQQIEIEGLNYPKDSYGSIITFEMPILKEGSMMDSCIFNAEDPRVTLCHHQIPDVQVESHYPRQPVTTLKDFRVSFGIGKLISAAWPGNTLVVGLTLYKGGETPRLDQEIHFPLAPDGTCRNPWAL